MNEDLNTTRNKTLVKITKHACTHTNPLPSS